MNESRNLGPSQFTFRDTQFRNWKAPRRRTIELAESAPTVMGNTAGTLSAPGSRRALAGFFLSGLLFSFFGSILPSWGHHLSADYQTIGALFFSASAGIVASIQASGWLLRRMGTGRTLLTGCALAAGALLYLAAVSPPTPDWTRMIGFALVGVAGGLLHSAIFLAIAPIYRHDPSATVNVGGTLFSLGCLAATLLISGTFYVYTVPSILILLAMIPVLFAVLYSRIQYAPVTRELRRTVRDVLLDVRSATAVLFALLLFFQFGNEWAIAGWLPLFLVQRLGISPADSLVLLAVYWVALLGGRIAVQALLPHVRHTAMLAGSMLLAMFGCLILAFTETPFGATTGIIFVGAGFASIYPLLARKVDHRFPKYHPGFYNGIVSLALTGGFLAPCMLGYVASWSGVRIVMLLPLFGTVMVLLLFIAIAVESRGIRHGTRTDPSPNRPS